MAAARAVPSKYPMSVVLSQQKRSFGLPIIHSIHCYALPTYIMLLVTIIAPSCFYRRYIDVHIVHVRTDRN
jgi:hypothetical protein